MANTMKRGYYGHGAESLNEMSDPNEELSPPSHVYLILEWLMFRALDLWAK